MSDRTAENEVDPEIDRLKDAYAAFLGMDRAAQLRSLDWLKDRLEWDHARAQGITS